MRFGPAGARVFGERRQFFGCMFRALIQLALARPALRYR